MTDPQSKSPNRRSLRKRQTARERTPQPNGVQERERTPSASPAPANAGERYNALYRAPNAGRAPQHGTRPPQPKKRGRENERRERNDERENTGLPERKDPTHPSRSVSPRNHNGGGSKPPKAATVAVGGVGLWVTRERVIHNSKRGV